MPLRSSSRRRGRRLVWWCVVIGLLGVGGYALHVPLLTWVGQQLVHRDALVRSDALLVLAGGVFDRELEAAELFTQGMAPRVLMTAEPDPDVFGELRARGVRVESSIDLRRRVLVELGVPAERVTVLPGLVSATLHEAQAALQWAQSAHAGSLLVVTSSFHTARARYVFLRVFKDAPVVLRFVPAARSDFQPESWWQRRNTLRDGLFELQRTLFYRLRY
jgi:uncharacterized SAM-binding protein YcdF (DUF218 family)